MTNSIETNDSLTLGWDSIPSTKYYLDSFVIVLYLEKPLIDFRVIVSIRNISALIFFPLLAKFRSSLWQSLAYFIKCFIIIDE